ncbi:hypothetical protein YC2023_044479 [Brassica napus]
MHWSFDVQSIYFINQQDEEHNRHPKNLEATRQLKPGSKIDSVASKIWQAMPPSMPETNT